VDRLAAPPQAVTIVQAPALRVKQGVQRLVSGEGGTALAGLFGGNGQAGAGELQAVVAEGVIETGFPPASFSGQVLLRAWFKEASPPAPAASIAAGEPNPQEPAAENSKLERSYYATGQGEAALEGQKLAQHGMLTIQSTCYPGWMSTVTEEALALLTFSSQGWPAETGRAAKAGLAESFYQGLKLQVGAVSVEGSGLKTVCTVLWKGAAQEIMPILQKANLTLFWEATIAWKAVGEELAQSVTGG
jgi:hypothetical protein